jgi:hypothetical protein
MYIRKKNRENAKGIINQQNVFLLFLFIKASEDLKKKLVHLNATIMYILYL